MTEIDDLVRLRLDSRVALPPHDVDAAWAGVEARIVRAKRRRRGAAAIGGLAAVALVSTLAVVLTDDGGTQQGQVVTDAPPSPDGPPPDPDVVVEGVSACGIPALVVATSEVDHAVAVVDLDQGVRAVYPADVHTVTDGGAVTDAVLTNRDELLTEGLFVPTRLYPAGPTDDGRNQLIAGALAEPGRDVHRVRTQGERTVVPTDDGASAWVLEFRSGDVGNTLELVHLASGNVRQSTTVAPQSRLLDVVGDSAVLDGDGVEPDTDVLVVAPSGETSTLRSPVPAVFVAASPSHSFWLPADASGTPGGDRLLAITADGQTTPIPTPEGEVGRWTVVGGPARPSDSRWPQPLTSDGRRLLLGLTNPTDPNHAPDRLSVVDIEQGTTEVIYEGGITTAFWGRDDRTVIVVSEEMRGDDIHQTLIAVDTVSGDTTTIDDAVPDGFAVIAGR